MDLAFSKEEMAFREEVRAFFRDNVPPETRRKLVRRDVISPRTRWSPGGAS